MNPFAKEEEKEQIDDAIYYCENCKTEYFISEETRIQCLKCDGTLFLKKRTKPITIQAS